MRKLITAMAAVLLFSLQLYAQKTITGKVTDDKGDPIPNVSILVKGTKTGTVTNADGMFSLFIQNNAQILLVSSVDMISQEISIGSQSTINISLKAEDKSLQEVVVTGYQVVRKKDVTAAISRISAADIDNLPIANFAQAMQGRAAGVSVSASNGIPGGALSVVIRGVGSISAGTNPLYVVDGIQLNTDIGSINTANNPLNFLNPDDIESIEILKDAAAASIYGARAANGVVLVTTKKGKAGKTKFNSNTYIGQSSPLKLLKTTTSQQWIELRTQANINAGLTPAAALTGALGNFGLPSNLSQGKIDSLPTYDWQDEAFGTGTIFNTELSMQGGTPNLTYYLSGSYSKQSSYIAPTDFQRGALLSKISFKINDKITLDNSISLSTFSQNAPYNQGNTGFGNPAFASSLILPINPIYNTNGTYYGLPGSGQSIIGTFNHNIIATGKLVNYFSRTNQFIGSSSLTYKPTSNLTLKTLIGMDYRLLQDHRYTDPRVNDFYSIGGLLTDQSDWNTNLITTTTANYIKRIGEKHNINILGGVEYRKDQNQWFTASVQGFPSYLLQYASAGATGDDARGQWTASSTFSQFGKVGYSFLSKYIFNYTIRRDGSSRFGSNNKFGVFHSAQVAWNAKEESFLKNVKAVSDLKLRYSFGQAGNDQIGNVLYAQLYGATRLYGNGSGIFPSQLGNPDLSWETREEQNIGLDLSLFKNRVSLTVDAYKKENENLLLARSLYQTTGFGNITQNLGVVENKGLEILLSVTPFNRVFKWVSSFNIAFQKNKVQKLYDNLPFLPGDASIRVGAPLGSFFTSEWAGVNPATGRAMWYDINGNITYNPGTADRKLIGSIFPKTYGGWNNNLTYKGFSLDAFFQYEYGRVRSDDQFRFAMRLTSATFNTLQYGYDTRWRKPGDIVPTPRPFTSTAETNSVSWETGSRFIYKTDYIRLKQLTLAYDLPNSILKRASIDGVKFYIQGLNLWTYTKWPGYDPEFTGANSGIIPQGKNVTMGLQVRF